MDIKWLEKSLSMESLPEPLFIPQPQPQQPPQLTSATLKVWDASTGQCLQTLDVGSALDYLRFDSDNLKLLTDVGAVAIDARPDPGANHRFGYGFNKDRSWITWHGNNFLWLPQEFRPVCSAVSGCTAVIGCNSGRVTLIKFST
jgi:hypothetical protein